MAERKINVAFFIGTSLLVGRGYERTTLNLAKHFDPSRFKVAIIHTDFLPVKRFDDSILMSMPEHIGIVEVKGRTNRFRNSIMGKIKKLPLGQVFNAIFVAPIILRLMARSLKIREINAVKEADLLYLADNIDVHLFDTKNKKVVGSNQGMFGNPQAVFTKLLIRLISSNIILRKVSAYHLFPMNQNLVELFGNKICKVIPSGIETEKFFPTAREHEAQKTKILFLAALEKGKGLMLAIKAFNLVSRNYDVELHIGGGGSLSGYVEAIAEKDEKIKYHGILPDEEVGKLYSDCDIFLYPSYGESFGLVVVEALSSGLRAIVGKRLLKNFEELNTNGFVKFCDYTPESVAEILKEELEKPIMNFNQKMGQHDYIAERYDWKNIALELMAFFEGVYNSKN